MIHRFQFCFNLAFKFNLRRYTLASQAAMHMYGESAIGRGLHSLTSELNFRTSGTHRSR